MEEDCRKDNQAKDKKASEAAFGSFFCIRHSSAMRRQCQFTVKRFQVNPTSRFTPQLAGGSFHTPTPKSSLADSAQKKTVE